MNEPLNSDTKMSNDPIDDWASPKWIAEQINQAKSEKERFAYEDVAYRCNGNLMTKSYFLELVRVQLKMR